MTFEDYCSKKFLNLDSTLRKQIRMYVILTLGEEAGG